MKVKITPKETYEIDFPETITSSGIKNTREIYSFKQDLSFEPESLLGLCKQELHIEKMFWFLKDWSFRLSAI